MFIKQALAETTAAATDTANAAAQNGGGIVSSITSIMPLIAILVVFYVMVIRPQNKRLQEHRNMIKNLQKGDRVVTGGGLIGKVKKLINDEEITVELAEGFDVHVMRSTILSVKDKA